MTHNEHAWKLLNDAHVAVAAYRMGSGSFPEAVTAYGRAERWLDEGPLDDVDQLDAMHESLAEVTAQLPDWVLR